MTIYKQISTMFVNYDIHTRCAWRCPL